MSRTQGGLTGVPPLQLARDPATGGDVLREVFLQEVPPHYEEANNPVFAALATHPNTPPDVLARLALRYSDPLLRNSILPLLPVEAPDFFEYADLGAAERLLRYPDLPAGMAVLCESAADVTSGWNVDPSWDWVPLREDARLHRSRVDDVDPVAWKKAIRAFWRGHVAASPEPLLALYRDAASVGLLPRWALDPAADPATADLARRLRRAADPTPTARRRKMSRDGNVLVRVAESLNPVHQSATHRRNRVTEVLGEMGVMHKWRLVESPCQSADDVITFCREMLDAKYGSGDDLGDLIPPLLGFLRHAGQSRDAQRDRPRSVRADDGEHLARVRARVINWVPLLAELIVFTPTMPGEGLSARTAATLADFAEDGNVLVRAAARARLAKPWEEFRL